MQEMTDVDGVQFPGDRTELESGEIFFEGSDHTRVLYVIILTYTTIIINKTMCQYPGASNKYRKLVREYFHAFTC